jgi:acetyl-CoA C-acetyltransferase
MATSLWGVPFYDRIQRARVMSQPEERYGILPAMMSWAETAAKEEGITREECDRWSLGSHQKACAAIEAGKFKEEMIPVKIVRGKNDSIIVDEDEGPRADTTLEKLSQLKPVLNGVCTAGNSSSENDGAAVVIVTSEEKAKELGIERFAKLKSFAVTGDDPRRTYKTVPKAVDHALKKGDLTIDQMDLVEIQEAFAAQVLADLKEMGITNKDYHKINVNGSGISLGHPIACTGTRVLVTLLHEMCRRNSHYGLECICGGGGLGIAAVFERV